MTTADTNVAPRPLFTCFHVAQPSIVRYTPYGVARKTLEESCWSGITWRTSVIFQSVVTRHVFPRSVLRCTPFPAATYRMRPREGRYNAAWKARMELGPAW